jgi:hypothetical protein
MSYSIPHAWLRQPRKRVICQPVRHVHLLLRLQQQRQQLPWQPLPGPAYGTYTNCLERFQICSNQNPPVIVAAPAAVSMIMIVAFVVLSVMCLSVIFAVLAVKDVYEVCTCLKIHGVPLNRYVGRGTNGLEKLGEEIHAENAEVVIPMAARWLERVPQLKERWANGIITASSVVFAVRGEDTARRPLKDEVRICGNRFTVERYQEERPDTQCSNCAKWGHVDSKCDSPARVKCNLCAEKHRTDQHQCQVVGCTKGKGQQCADLIIKCPNCKGAHVGWRSTKHMFLFTFLSALLRFLAPHKLFFHSVDCGSEFSPCQGCVLLCRGFLFVCCLFDGLLVFLLVFSLALIRMDVKVYYCA